MDLSFSDEQRLLQQSAQRYLTQQYSFAERQRIVNSASGVDMAKWREMAQLGWLALPFAESLGGLGGTAIDVHILAQAFGQALVVEPYFSSVILCGSLVASVGAPIHRETMVAQIAAGELQVALAHEEPRDRLAAMAADAATTTTPGWLPQTQAISNSNGWQLSGIKANVLGAGSAQVMIVSARLGSARQALGDRCGLFLIRPNSHGVRLRPVTLIDGQRAATVELDAVRVAAMDRLDDPQAGASACNEALANSHQRAMLFAASQAGGSMQALLDATLSYTKTRIQFGQPLAANQVIKHRLVDMAIACEEAQAIALRAAIVVSDTQRNADTNPQGANRERCAIAAAAARIKVARCARYVAEQAVQLHGGMGVTEELNIGAYFKSLLAFELRFGAAEQVQRQQFERLRQRATQEAGP